MKVTLELYGSTIILKSEGMDPMKAFTASNGICVKRMDGSCILYSSDSIDLGTEKSASVMWPINPAETYARSQHFTGGKAITNHGGRPCLNTTTFSTI